MSKTTVEITDRRYLGRLARALNVHEHVYHPAHGRIIAGEWGVTENRLIVRTNGSTLTINNPEYIHDGNMRPIVVSRVFDTPRPRVAMPNNH